MAMQELNHSYPQKENLSAIKKKDSESIIVNESFEENM